MPHHVYANNNEIATKSSDGKSAACFPDVCFSPPTPPASGVPIPYANTCFAKDITNGSKTVIIGGAEVALENHSYFESSVGDAPATHALKKGIRSGNVDGRGFFQTWSQNVKVEGRGVCRHMDLVTHNHTNSGNTVPNKFISLASGKSKCDKQLERIKLTCKTKTEQDKQNSILKKILGKQKYEKFKSLTKSSNNASKGNWVGDYCDGLMMKPNPLKGSSAKTRQELEGYYKDLGDISSKLSNIKSEIIDQFDFWGRLLANGADIAKRKAINAGVRHGAGLAASVVPPAEVAVQIGLAVWTAGDAASGIFSLVGSYNELSNIKNLFESQLNRLEQIAQDAKDNPQKAMAELMTIIATINGCVRNRRCMLIPYSATKNPAQTLRGEGCCPGQTGHHVMPESMFKGSNCTPSYNGRNAPTICLEGVNNSHGSHGAAHSALKSQLKDITDKISYPDARDYAVKAVMRVAPQCSKKCFEEQLDTYHSGCDKKTGFGGLLDEKHLAPSDGTKAKTTTYTF